MFDIDLDTPLSDERKNQMLNAIARKIVNRRLETPAVLFLDMHKPLSFIASQSLLVAMPLVGLFVEPQDIADFSKILQDRENIDLLVSRIEDMADKDEIVTKTAKEQES